MAPARTEATSTNDITGPTNNSTIPTPTRSRQVSWWSVHEHVAPALAQAASWPTVGTPAWCALGDDDPRKQAALYDAAQHWALRLETNQEARADASREISAAADWSAIGTEWFRINQFYAARPWLKRVVW
jgi:hypothetical protein